MGDDMDVSFKLHRYERGTVVRREIMLLSIPAKDGVAADPQRDLA
jgi:hypothetical protein